MRRWTLLGLVGIVVAATGCISVNRLLAGQMRTVVVRESPRWFETNRIALIDVEGFIGSSGPLWLLGANTTIADTREKLERAEKDPGVRAIVLRINSPGGEVNASDTVYREILRFKEETEKPVVAALGSTAASGGYYVALAADRIVASPACVTGSVGVVIRYTNVEGLFDKLGLRSVVIKAGGKKDMGSPTRALTPEERQILENVAQSFHEQFLRAVRSARPNLPDGVPEQVADARILTARQALKMRLVDQIGYLDDAIDMAKKLADVEHADIVLYRPFPHYNTNIYAASGAGAAAGGIDWSSLLPGAGPQFLYLWQPGL